MTDLSGRFRFGMSATKTGRAAPASGGVVGAMVAVQQPEQTENQQLVPFEGKKIQQGSAVCIRGR